MRPAVVKSAHLSDRDRAQVGPRQLKEPGSPDWCWQTVYYLKDCMRHVSEEWRQAEQVLEELVKTRAWLVIPPDGPYGSLNKMLKAEVGLDEKAIKDLIRQAELAAHGGNYDHEAKKFGASPYNISTGQHGTSEAYTIRRLRRDRPDLAESVERGDLSANEAAIAAGFRGRQRSMTIPKDDAERAFRRLSGDNGMDRDQLLQLAKLLQAHLLNE